MINRWMRCLVVLLLAVLCLHMAVPAYALSDEDRRAVDLDSVWHKTYRPVQACSTTGPSTVNGVGGSGQPGTLYLLGDSIGTQIGPSIATNLAGQSWSVQTYAASGRTLPEALAIIDQDADIIRGSTVVVIELGTNTGGFTPENISAAIDKIRALNPTASIYWVDTAVVQRQDYAQSLNAVNSIIYAQSAQKNYQVISWNKKVFGDSADPQNINADAPDNGYIRRADQFVHLTDEGVAAMAELIGSVVLNASANGTVSCPVGSSSCLVGGDPAEKAWHFLIRKGLSPIQAAGIMGNIGAESHFEPRLVEYGWPNSRGETSVQGEPSSLDDNVPPPVGPRGEPGYGLAQWTSVGRKQGLADKAAGAGIIAGDLKLQLEYLFEESSGRGDWEALLATTTVEDATLIWHNRYEGSNDNLQRLQGRIAIAYQNLEAFGSSTPTGIGAC